MMGLRQVGLEDSKGIVEATDRSPVSMTVIMTAR